MRYSCFWSMITSFRLGRANLTWRRFCDWFLGGGRFRGWRCWESLRSPCREWPSSWPQFSGFGCRDSDRRIRRRLCLNIRVSTYIDSFGVVGKGVFSKIWMHNNYGVLNCTINFHLKNHIKMGRVLFPNKWDIVKVTICLLTQIGQLGCLAIRPLWESVETILQ